MKKVFLFLILLFCLPCLSFADNTQTLRVGLLISPPFVMKEDGVYTGLAVHLWQRIAIANGWQYQYVELQGDTDKNLKSLANGKLDVIVGGISATYLRLQYADFTRPYFLNSIVAVTHKPTTNFSGVRKFMRHALVYLAISFVVCFFAYINLLWFFERGKMPDIPENYFAAIKNELWFLLLKRRLIPSTTYGRLVALVWIILSLFVFSSLNASITSTLTVALSHSKGNIETLRDLQKIKVTATEGSSAAVAGANSALMITLAPSYLDAMKMLREGEVEGVLTNAVGAENYLKQEKMVEYVVNPFVLQNEEYSFALPIHSPLRRPLDLGITKLQDNQDMLPLCQRFIPTEYMDRCNL